MEITKKLIKKEEVLRYLGYRGSEIPPHTERLIDGCIIETLGMVRPSYLYQKYSIHTSGDGIHLDGTEIVLTGKDIQAHLNGCQEVYLLCATIGMFVDKNIRLRMVMEPAAGVILDSCGSVAVEQVVDAVEKEIEKEVMEQGKQITWRFSPGYGDLPLTIQRDIADILDIHRKLGVSVNEDMLMTPSKSVTAIIGVLEHASDCGKQEEGTKENGLIHIKEHKCERCKNRERCNVSYHSLRRDENN